jgi:hypothetical protein
MGAGSRRVSLMLFFACLSVSTASAQSRATSADLTGIVRDQSHAVVPQASITAINLDTNLERVAESGSDGRFDIPAVRTGAYRVRVEFPGFAPFIAEPVELSLGSSVSLDVVLYLANVSQQVTVSAASPTGNLQQTVIANVVSQRQISDLPINGRNFMSFSLIVPGVVADRMPIQGVTSTSGLSFAGQRARSNNITVDGLDNNDETVGGVRATFSQEAVQEFQVLTQSYSAEFGKAAGGVVNIVTKSGTNVRSGSLFSYFRDDALNAKEHFEAFDPDGRSVDQAKAPYHQKQFGGVLGGPLKKNRTFFFGSFERLDVAANNFVTIDDKTPVAVAGQPSGTAADILRRAGFPIQTGHVPYDVRSNHFVTKLDHNIRPTQTLTLRYNYADGYNGNSETWGGLNAESRGASLHNQDQMFAASHTAILSPRFVNEMRLQVATRQQSVLGLDPTCAGPCDRLDEGGPTLEIAGVANVGRNRLTPQFRENMRYQVVDTMSYGAGKHLWKSGVDFNVVDHPQSSLPLHFGGRYIFAPLPAIPGLLSAPISAIQAVALGLPAAYVQGYGNAATSYATRDLSAFIQDQWRVNQTLTVQAGARYQAQFWQARPYTIPGYGTYQIPGDYNNLAPRLGFAWNPSGDKKTSLHGAYGVYYDNVISAGIGVANVVNGASDGLRTLVLRFPQSLTAWNAPGRRLSESAGGTFPSLTISIDPNLKASYSHQLSVGLDRALGAQTTVAAAFLYGRGFNQLGTIDYNPVVPSLGAGRRPEDVNGIAGTTASILQYTSYGDTWYRAVTFAMRKRFADRYQFLASYVLSKAEDNSSDFQTTFIPQSNGQGRDRSNPDGLPIGFDPANERGAALQDQRHRFTMSGSYEGPGGLRAASIVTISSGVPFNILAGTDLNGDGDGGTFPTDRARRIPSDPASAVPRNAGRLPTEATVDVRVSRKFRLLGRSTIEPMLDVFNLFNRVNFTDVNNVFGIGAFPDSPLLTYGKFQRAAQPLQAQLAVRIVF